MRVCLYIRNKNTRDLLYRAPSVIDEKKNFYREKKNIFNTHTWKDFYEVDLSLNLEFRQVNVDVDVVHIISSGFQRSWVP